MLSTSTPRLGSLSAEKDADHTSRTPSSRSLIEQTADDLLDVALLSMHTIVELQRIEGKKLRLVISIYYFVQLDCRIETSRARCDGMDSMPRTEILKV